MAHDSTGLETRTVSRRSDERSTVPSSELQELRDELEELKERMANMDIGVNVVRSPLVATHSTHEQDHSYEQSKQETWNTLDQNGTTDWYQTSGGMDEHWNTTTDWRQAGHGEEYLQESDEWWLGDGHGY